MWPSLVKFQYTELKLSCGNDPVVNNSGRPYRFPHNNSSSVYRIFTKLGHVNPLWKGNNSIYFGVITSKVKVTITINRIVDNRSLPHDNFSSVYWVFSKLGHMIPLWKGKNNVYFGVIRSKVKVTVIMWPSLVKLQYTELKLSCGNDPVVKNSIYSNGDLDL
jgi:hypothetical protein